jgi:hypothetical protein
LLLQQSCWKSYFFNKQMQCLIISSEEMMCLIFLFFYSMQSSAFLFLQKKKILVLFVISVPAAGPWTGWLDLRRHLVTSPVGRLGNPSHHPGGSECSRPCGCWNGSAVQQSSCQRAARCNSSTCIWRLKAPALAGTSMAGTRHEDLDVWATQLHYSGQLLTSWHLCSISHASLASCPPFIFSFAGGQSSTCGWSWTRCQTVNQRSLWWGQLPWEWTGFGQASCVDFTISICVNQLWLLTTSQLALRGSEQESWWTDLKVDCFFCFWRSSVSTFAPSAALDPSSSPAVQLPRVLFYKITGEQKNDQHPGFRPAYSAINTPQPYWWVDSAAQGLL